MWHDIEDCQLCNMFDQIDQFGPPVTPEPHKPVLYPDDEPANGFTAEYIIYDEAGEAGFERVWINDQINIRTRNGYEWADYDDESGDSGS